MDWMNGALGDGWLGKGLALCVGGAAAWVARRPAERAAVLVAVDKRVATLLEHLEGEVQRATTRCEAVETSLRDERARCDQELAALRAEIAHLMGGPVPMYEVRAPRGKKP